MKKYNVELVSHKVVEIEADSALDAVKLAKGQNPGFRSDGVFDGADFLDVEICNGCAIDMLETEVGGADSDGNSYCKDCFAASQQDYHEWIHALTTLGYDKKVMIGADFSEEVSEMYSDGKEPAEALQYLIANDMVTPIPDTNA